MPSNIASTATTPTAANPNQKSPIAQINRRIVATQLQTRFSKLAKAIGAPAHARAARIFAAAAAVVCDKKILDMSDRLDCSRVSQQRFEYRLVGIVAGAARARRADVEVQIWQN